MLLAACTLAAALRPSPACRAPTAVRVQMMCAAPPPVAADSDADELVDELLDLVEDAEAVCDRGIGAPAELCEDILEVVGELEETFPPEVGWSDSADLAGRWQLRYTSSKTFANNRGLTGYARDLSGVETPETFMDVQTQFKRLVYEESLAFEKGSMASVFGRFANARVVKVECRWSETRDGAMAVESQRVVVGSNSWEPADRQDKAVRTLGAARPIYLDDELLVMRSQPEYIVWVFTK